MNRRDFVKASIGAPLIVPLETLSSEAVTHIDSESISGALPPADQYNLHFIAIGDWGRSGEYLQAEVGEQMGLWASKNRTQFVISTGDNFYPKGVISEHDPLWHFSFENIYKAHALQCDWYPVLGNHDYGADPDAQVRYSMVSRRWKMAARYYSREMSLGKGKGKVLFVMTDTNPLVDESRKDESAKQLEWLDNTLSDAADDVKWKIVVGHHPAYTVGPRIKNYDVLTIREAFTKIFEKHRVDVYLSGHEHSLQHLKPEGFTHQFISGAGSALSQVTAGVAYSKFEASQNGFMYVAMNEQKLLMKAVNQSGAVLYETELTK